MVLPESLQTMKPVHLSHSFTFPPIEPQNETTTNNLNTVKPVLSGHSKIYKTKILKRLSLQL